MSKSAQTALIALAFLVLYFASFVLASWLIHGTL